MADYNNKFVSKDELEKVVCQDVISLKDVDDVMAKLINEMEICAKEDRVMCSMADVKCMVYEKTKELHNAKKNVSSEIPINHWVYDYFCQQSSL